METSYKTYFMSGEIKGEKKVKYKVYGEFSMLNLSKRAMLKYINASIRFLIVVNGCALMFHTAWRPLVYP